MIREQELAALRASTMRALSGEGPPVWLVGEAGSGKTWLLGRLDVDAPPDWLTLRWEGPAMEADIAYAALHGLLQPALAWLGTLTAPMQQVILTALGYEASVEVQPLALRLAVMTLLASASIDRPIVLLVDDVQWLDGPSRSALQFCARRALHERIAFVFASRPEGAPDTMAEAERLLLEPLALADRRQLLLEAAPDGRLDPVALDELVGTTGNPLLLLEQARVRADGTQPQHAPSPLVFGGRLSALPERCRLALGVLAADELAPEAMLRAVLAGVGVDWRDLDDAVRDGIIMAAGGGLRFAHPLATSAATLRTNPDQRAQIHRLFAEQWAARGAVDRIVHHLERTSEPPTPDRYLQLGDLAQRRGAADIAANAFRRAAAGQPEPARRAELLLRSAHAYAAQLDLASAADVVSQIEQLDLDNLLTDTALIRAQRLLWTGQLNEARALLVRAATDVQHRSPLRAVTYLTEACHLHAISGDLTGTVTLAEQAMAAAAGGGDEATKLAAATYGRALILNGEAHVGRRGHDLVVATLPFIIEHPVATSLSMTAAALAWAGDFARCRMVLDRVLHNDELPFHERPFALGIESDLLLQQGQPAKAHARATEALEVAGEVGVNSGWEHACVARAAAMLGRADFAEHAKVGLQMAADGIGALALLSGGAFGTDALARGNFDEATTRFRQAFSLVRLDDSKYQLEPDLIEALHLSDDSAAAAEEARSFVSLAERVQRPWLTAAAKRVQGLTTRGDDADRHFAQADTLMNRLPSPYDRGRTALCWGEHLLDRGNRLQAQASLANAAAAFEHIGAQTWYERAEQALRGAGRTRRKQTTTLALTERELQVAVLVAEGLTNIEIAERLFVGQKTVEYHLTNIYRNNALRTRTQLARAMLRWELGYEHQATRLE